MRRKSLRSLNLFSCKQTVDHFSYYASLRGNKEHHSIIHPTFIFRCDVVASQPYNFPVLRFLHGSLQ